MLLASFAARVHCLLMFHLVSARSSRSFLQSCFPSGWPRVRTGARGYPPPRARRCSPLHCVPPADFSLQCLSEHQHSHPTHRLLHPLLYHPQTCRGCSIPSSQPLMEMLACTGPSVDLWGTTLMSGLPLDFMSLITTL